MRWYDPKNWLPQSDYGIVNIESFCDYFETPLLAQGLQRSQVIKEWKLFKNHVDANYPGVDVKTLWKKIFVYKKSEFPNMCLMAELIMCLSGSNSTVERAFSLLTLLLSDRRLRLKHKTLEEIMIIKINNKIWTKAERNEIIESALNKYLSKRRTTRMQGLETSTGKTSSFETTESDSEWSVTDDDSSSSELD